MIPTAQEFLSEAEHMYNSILVATEGMEFDAFMQASTNIFCYWTGCVWGLVRCGLITDKQSGEIMQQIINIRFSTTEKAAASRGMQCFVTKSRAEAEQIMRMFNDKDASVSESDEDDGFELGEDKPPVLN